MRGLDLEVALTDRGGKFGLAHGGTVERYGTSRIGARQKVVLREEGSRTEIWQS